MPHRTAAPASNYDPCNNPRPITDPAGRLADLVNCYITMSEKAVSYYLPLAAVAILLLAVMILAAYMFLKE
jgi:hypothetical protein